MARENKSKFAILGFLAHEPLSGYDIKKRIESGVNNFYDISYGQIYPELSKMELGGLVTKEVETNEKGPARKIYTITSAGRSALKEWVATGVEEEKVQYDILLKLFFGSQVSIEENIRNIKGFRDRNLKKLKMLEAFEQNLRGVLGESKDHIFYLQTVLFGIGVCHAYINWANQAILDLTEFSKERNGGVT